MQPRDRESRLTITSLEQEKYAQLQDEFYVKHVAEKQSEWNQRVATPTQLPT